MLFWGFTLRRSSQALCPSWAAGHHRLAHSAAGAKELRDLSPKYFPFEVTADEAKHRYLKWQNKNWLTPSNLLAPDKYILTPVMLPYWLFTLKANVQYTGTVGLKPSSNSSSGTSSSSASLLWKEVGWSVLDKTETEFSPEQPEMQIHASYQHRRDFAEAMKRGLPQLAQAQALTKAEVEKQEISLSKKNNGKSSSDSVKLEVPEMRKAIAWEFALRGSHEIARKRAYEQLKQAHSAEKVKNINVVVSPMHKQATLLYVPAYSLSYVHGETHNVHGERQPQHFSGLISGLENGSVAGERHVSVSKTATFGGSLTLGLMGILSVLSPLIGADPFMWTSFDFVFSAMSVGAASGLLAQMAPNFLLRNAETNKFEEEIAGKGETLSSSFPPPPPPLPDFEGSRDFEETQRTHLEWLRWEESEKRVWNAEKRQRWAQQLWEAQHFRRREQKRVLEQAERQQARRQSEEFRERKRRSRWGPRSTQYMHHEFLGGAKGRADFKGYYKALALDPSLGHVSSEEIKRAFRKSAMLWHPDKHVGAAEKKKARDQFLQIRTAYETLRDPERRKNYDLGLPHGESPPF